MSKDSVQKKLQKVRPPRVQMTYDVEVGDAVEQKELPFVAGVLGDFAGQSEKDQKRLKDRKFVNVDMDNFDEVMEGIAPRAVYRVENKLSPQGGEFAVDLSFNSITIDGDTSTNDSFMLISTGQSSAARIDSVNHPAYEQLKAALLEVAIELAQAIVRDGEGATKFITVQVEGGRTIAECKAVGYAIGRSPLVKTAFFASDPNLGRLLAAIGYAGIQDLDVDRVEMYLDDVLVAKDGGRNPDYKEEDGQRVMKQDEITVRVVLNRGLSSATVWTCDFSYDYVRINADYRS